MQRVLFMVILVWSSVLSAFELDEFWVRGTAEDLARLRALSADTNTTGIGLLYKDVEDDWFERTLSEAERRKVVQLIASFSLTTDKVEHVGAVRVVARLELRVGDALQTRVQIDIGMNDQALLSFHRARYYDITKRCFEVPGAANTIRELVRQPGARKLERPPVVTPPPPPG